MNTVNNTTAISNQSVINAAKFFIPEVLIIAGIQVPSTPYKTTDNKVIYMGDIIEVAFPNDGIINKEFYLIDMKDGQYMATAKNENYNTPLWCLVGDDEEGVKLTNLGSSISNPELLNKIK